MSKVNKLFNSSKENNNIIDYFKNPKEATRKIYIHFISDSLYKNSIYLMSSTFILAFFGFFFWIISTKFYTPQDVGLATTILSIITLISSLSVLGLNVGMIRYLPNISNKNSLINSSFFVVGFFSILFSIIFIFGLNIFSPKLVFIRENILLCITFVIFILSTSLNLIVDSIFIAFRSSKYVLLKNSIFSFIKVLSPLLFIALGAFGVVMGVGIGTLSAFLISILFLIYKFEYNAQLQFDLKQMKKVASYSFLNYLATFFGGLPQTVLPILITNKVGAQETAYFYIAMMIANLIYIIPQSVNQSLFAEGSYDDSTIRIHIKKAIKAIILILTPAIILSNLLGKSILSVFGKYYENEAFTLLQLLVLSSIFISMNSIMGTILRLKNKIKELIFMAIINFILILLLSMYLLEYKLFGIGIAWLISQLLITIIYIVIIKRIVK